MKRITHWQGLFHLPSKLSNPRSSSSRTSRDYFTLAPEVTSVTCSLESWIKDIRFRSRFSTPPIMECLRIADGSLSSAREREFFLRGPKLPTRTRMRNSQQMMRLVTFSSQIMGTVKPCRNTEAV